MWPLAVLTGFFKKKICMAVSPAQRYVVNKHDKEVIVMSTVRRSSTVTEFKHFTYQICSVFRPASSTNCESP